MNLEELETRQTQFCGHKSKPQHSQKTETWTIQFWKTTQKTTVTNEARAVLTIYKREKWAMKRK
jgi:hypothetical protein